MNRQKFNIPGGYPLETDTLFEIQNAYKLFNALGQIAGDKAIIAGCEEEDTTVNDGILYLKDVKGAGLKGEVFEFRGGAKRPTVIIKEDISSKIFEDGEEHEVLYKRYISFGSGEGAMDWNDFKRFRSLLDLQKAATPKGTIVMWSGALNNLPSGWYLCDGTNDTPDLRNRFIVGAGDTYAVKDKGGADQITLTTDQLPSHNHSASSDSAGDHVHAGSIHSGGNHSHYYRDDFHLDYNIPSASGQSYSSEALGRKKYHGTSSQLETTTWIWYRNRYTNSSGEHSHNLSINRAGTHTHEVTIANTGGGQALENRPPYYALAYIMFKGA